MVLEGLVPHPTPPFLGLLSRSRRFPGPGSGCMVPWQHHPPMAGHPPPTLQSSCTCQSPTTPSSMGLPLGQQPPQGLGRGWGPSHVVGARLPCPQRPSSAPAPLGQTAPVGPMVDLQAWGPGSM